MSQPAEEIERIATLIGCDYYRSITLSELNQDIHYNNARIKPLVVFNGVPDVVTTFSGAEAIDTFSTEIHFLVMQPRTTENAEDVDVLLNDMKVKANDFFYKLNYPDTVVRWATTYTLALSTTGNDMLIGYMMTINLPFSNNKCS